MKPPIDKDSDCSVPNCYNQAVGYVLTTDPEIIYFCHHHENYPSAFKILASVNRFLSPPEMTWIVTAERRAENLGIIITVVMITGLLAAMFIR